MKKAVAVFVFVAIAVAIGAWWVAFSKVGPPTNSTGQSLPRNVGGIPQGGVDLDMSPRSQVIAATELVWHRANREADLVGFLASGVRWAECDARLDPQGVVRVSHEPLDGTSEWLELTDWLEAIRGAGRSAKIDLKEGGPVIGAALGAATRTGFHDEDLWFNAAVEVLGGEAGFRRLADAHPRARFSCPLDTLASYLLVVPPAYAVIDLLGAWGINWLCLGSQASGAASLVPAMLERGWPVNIWDVEEADDLERALSFAPEAITADLDSVPLVALPWARR